MSTGNLALCSHFTLHPYDDGNGYYNSDFVTHYLRIYDLETGECIDTIRIKCKGEPHYQYIAARLHECGYTRDQFFLMWDTYFDHDGTLNDPPHSMDVYELPNYSFEYCSRITGRTTRP